MPLSDFFKYFGIAIAVMIVDAAVCLFCVWISDSWDDDEGGLILALAINFIGLALALSILIGERLG